MVQRVSHFEKKRVRHFLRETVPDEDALDDEVFAVGRHGIGRNKPAPLPQPIRIFVKRES